MKFVSPVLRYALVSTLVIISHLGLGAQDGACGTAEPTPAFIKKVIYEYPLLGQRNPDVMSKVPIKAHIVRKDDMTGGLTFEDLTIGIGFLNAMYEEADIEFFVCDYEEVGDSDYFDFNTTAPDDDTETGLVALTTPADNAVNVYFVDTLTTSSGALCGYARLPFDSDVANRIVMRNGCTAGFPNGTFAHEFGHYFSLLHTHQGTSGGPGGANAENVPRTGDDANCDTKGDLLCDTEADPKAYAALDINNCTYTDDSTDINGVQYDPPIDNVMSYWTDFCGGIFTTGQSANIASGLADRLTHTSYSLDCIATDLDQPTDLNGSAECGTVTLTWTDIETDEVGYLIERSSTSASSGYQAIPFGATGPDGNSYADQTAQSFTTYWYRIKTANGDPDDYSNVSEVLVGGSYCTPGAAACDWTGAREYLSHVSIGTIDNTSGCDEDGYECFSDLSTTVVKGQAYTIDATIGSYFGADDAVTVYVDWNQNGSFEDAGEDVDLTLTTAPDFTGTINVPMDAVSGVTTLRARARYNTNPGPCGLWTYSEAEDYTLIVDVPLPITLLDFSGRKLNHDAVLEWTTTDEINNLGFHILQSNGGFEFTEIGFVEAATDRLAVHQYSFVHLQAPSGSNYYILEQEDADGTRTKSPIVELNFDAFVSSPKIYPNPNKGDFTISGLPRDAVYSLDVFSIDGRMISSDQMSSDVQGKISVSDQGLADGVYFVSLRNSGDVVNFKVVVQR